MKTYAAQRVRSLSALDLSGYILKRGSPSCGIERIVVHGDAGDAEPSGRGFFAEELLSQLTLLPVEEEGRLQDSASRKDFIERVFVYHRLHHA
jgi:uncharacterized protein YbbK (DUF523 family)